MSPASVRHNLVIPDELWRRIVRAAAKETARTGERVTASEYVRRAVSEKLEREEGA